MFFTSLDHMPVVPVAPLMPCVANEALLLGYSVAQPEQYHSVVSMKNVNLPQVSSMSSTSSEYVPNHCSCGRGAAKKHGRKFCQQAPNGKKSRCKCYTNEAGCTHRCKCICCGNPYGSSEAAKQAYSHLSVSRYRPKQKLQEVRESSTSLEYLMKHGVNPVTGWTDVESLTLDCLVDLTLQRHLCIEAAKMHECYTRLHEISNKLGNPLQPKKLEQIEGKLFCIKKVALEALYKKQVELNWFS